jgi:hypothetical protein
LHKRKQTLKITISFTKPKGIAYKFKPKKNAPCTFSMEKEGGTGKGFLKTIIKQGIGINFLKKKPHPSFQLERMGCVINY